MSNSARAARLATSWRFLWRPDSEIDSTSVSCLKPLLSVLSSPYFDEDGAALVQFIAHEYVAPLSSCVHLLTPVGRAPKVVKRGDVWELQKPARRRKKKGEAEAPAPLDEDIAEAAEAREDFALTEGQAAALACVDACIDRCAGEACVVDGVTRSGQNRGVPACDSPCARVGAWRHCTRT